MFDEYKLRLAGFSSKEIKALRIVKIQHKLGLPKADSEEWKRWNFGKYLYNHGYISDEFDTQRVPGRRRKNGWI